jgi:iron complex transport system permease protein
MALAWLYSRDLNALLLGEECALNLGVDVERTKRVVLVGAALASAAAVSVSGIIGFVGLIAPHIVRLIQGPDHRALIPASALTGALFLVICDTLARTLFAPTEMPIGVLTAFTGVPFFLSLLRRSRQISRDA